jgi:hypothetical protein
MKVQKRNGDIVPVLFDKVVKRLANLCDGLDVQPDKVAQKVFTNMYDGIKTSEIDDLSAEVAVHMQTEHPDYEVLATRIVASNMHKMSPKCFSDSMLALHSKGIVSNEFMKCVAIALDGYQRRQWARAVGRVPASAVAARAAVNFPQLP